MKLSSIVVIALLSLGCAVAADEGAGFHHQHIDLDTNPDYRPGTIPPGSICAGDCPTLRDELDALRKRIAVLECRVNNIAMPDVDCWKVEGPE